MVVMYCPGPQKGGNLLVTGNRKANFEAKEAAYLDTVMALVPIIDLQKHPPTYSETDLQKEPRRAYIHDS